MTSRDKTKSNKYYSKCDVQDINRTTDAKDVKLKTRPQKSKLVSTTN
jgi:hypothetical protein